MVYPFFSFLISSSQTPCRKEKSRFVCCGFVHGEPASPISESLAIIELSSHSSGEGTSDSGAPELDGDWDIRKKVTHQKPAPPVHQQTVHRWPR